MSGSQPVDQSMFTSCRLNFALKNVPVAAALFLALTFLGGCVETTAAIPPAPGLDHRYFLREDANLAAVKVAVMSLSGAPDEFQQKFKTAFEADTRRLQLDLVPEKADYFLRGYLTAYPSEDGTAVAAVWDIFDSHKKRAQRLADQIVLPKSAEPGSWTSLSPEDWEKFAGLSAASLAAFVSNTPEADNNAKQGLAKVALSVDGTPEAGNPKGQDSSAMNEGRTIAVKSAGEALPNSKIASFH